MDYQGKPVEVGRWANLYPRMRDDEFRAFSRQVKADGLQQPILLIDRGDKWEVVDGKNRLRACEQEMVDPRFEVWEGEHSDADILNKVLALNSFRRNLNTTQKAMVAAQVAEELNKIHNKGKRSVEIAAEMLGIGERVVSSARFCLNQIDAMVDRAIRIGADTEEGKQLIRKATRYKESLMKGTTAVTSLEAKLKIKDEPRDEESKAFAKLRMALYRKVNEMSVNDLKDLLIHLGLDPDSILGEEPAKQTPVEEVEIVPEPVAKPKKKARK